MDIGKQTRIEIDKYDTLQKIVDQLEFCNYETDGRCLTNNVAFLKLKEMAIEQQRISDTPILSDVRSKIDAWVDCDMVEIIIRGNDGFDGQEVLRGNVAKTEFKRQIRICFE